MKTSLLVVLFLPVYAAAPLSDVSTGDQGDTAIHEHNAHEDGPEAESKERLRLLFKTIDVNRDGIMDAKELIGVCLANNINIEEAEAERAVTLSDKTVGLTMDMFVELLAHCTSSKTEDIIFFFLHGDRRGRFIVNPFGVNFQQWPRNVLKAALHKLYAAPTCKGGATLLSTSPGLDMVLCKDETESTCQKDFESLCPAGWNLCTPGQFNNRNDGWDYNWEDANAGIPLGVIYCYTKGGRGVAAHYGIYNAVMNTDEGLNCRGSSSRPGCEAFAGDGRDCNGKARASAVCCAPTRTCGDGLVQQEEDCDDGNDSNMDDCLNSCTWKKPEDHGLSGFGCE